MLSVVPAHRQEDAPFARQLSGFLEAGCDVTCFSSEAVIKPGHDLIAAADEGLCADVLVLLLSPESTPSRWVRERWEPVLFGRTAEMNTRVLTFVLRECAFPGMLRKQRTSFTTNQLVAMRQLKRWLPGIQTGADLPMVFSPDLETLYTTLADQPGQMTASGETAVRFEHEASTDFESVFWIPAYHRTLAQIAGELGSQLRMTLDSELEDNCRRIHGILSGKRCLLILDAPQVSIDPILPSTRASILITSHPVRVVKEVPSLAAARSLVAASRFAEAYEMLYTLLGSAVETEACARQLVWICEHWDRLEEANKLRFHFGPSPSEQLRLF